MPITGAIDGLNDAIESLQGNISDLNRGVQRLTGSPIPTQQGITSVRNRKAIVWQIEGLPESLRVPDLMMSINPKNLSSKYTQLINRKRTFGGFIEEHWGEQLDSLSASGETGSFFGPLGLTNANRRDTEEYEKFEQLLSMYRNNGSIYDTRSGKIVAQGSIVMNYDSCIYDGYFDNFSVTDSADKPFSLSYNFSFKVTREIYPGRIKSFASITTVSRPGAPRNDTVTLDITTFSGSATTQGAT